MNSDNQGKEITIEETITFNNETEAKLFFVAAKDRFSRINAWSKLAGDLSADFTLLDRDRTSVERSPEEGDFIRIDIPGPGSRSGDGYDWVKIESVTIHSTEDEDTFSFRVRPTHNPFGSEEEVAHFYSSESTSTFLLTRIKKTIVAGIYDQHIKGNRDIARVTDKIRHEVISVAGMLGYSKLQWTKLVNAILQREN